MNLEADWDGAVIPGRPVLVLLHGFAGSRESWSPLREALRRLGATLAVELPGHGPSPAPGETAPYPMEACLDSLEALWRKLGLPPAWWVGYSMGGRTALQLAVRKPALVAGLVLESATPGLEDAAQRAERVQADQALADFILAEGVAAFVERWLALPLFAGLRRLPPEQQAAQRALRLAHSAAGLAGSLRGMGTGAMEPVWNQLEEVAVPTLLLVGEEDEKFVEIARRMADKMARSTLRIVPQAGHTLHAEAQAAYLAAVNEFFASSGATP